MSCVSAELGTTPVGTRMSFVGNRTIDGGEIALLVPRCVAAAAQEALVDVLARPITRLRHEPALAGTS